jgi:hypothetical protein
MSTPWAQSATLTSTSQFSTPIALDPLSKMTAVQVSVTGTSSAALSTFYVQATLDTPAYGSAVSTPLPQPQPIWGQIGSSIYTFSSGVGITNLAALDGSATFVLLQPVAGLRLASSAAGGVLATATVVLRALQSPSA